jgi:hypothetical protein
MPDINRERRVKENPLDNLGMVVSRTQVKQFLPDPPQLTLSHMLLDLDAQDRHLIRGIADPNQGCSIYVCMVVENTFARDSVKSPI